MNETEWTEESPTEVRRTSKILRGFLVGAALIVVLLGMALGIRGYVESEGRGRFEALMAETDRRDPGWRWEDLLANRPVVPEQVNGATRVVAAVDLLPKRGAYYPKRSPKPQVKKEVEELDPASFPATASSADPTQDLVEAVFDRSPAQRLDADLVADLRAEMVKMQPALAEARKLARLPSGRHPITYARDILSTRIDTVQDTRAVVNLLTLDLALAAEEGDRSRALTDARAAFNAGRSIGDELIAVCFLVRLACVQASLRSLERLLAQGELTDEELAGWQELLRDEVQQPLFLAALRGERASSLNTTELVFTGELDMEQISRGGGTGRMSSALQWAFVRPMVRQNQIALLEMMNEAVEISKRPPADQLRAWTKWEHDLKSLKTAQPHLSLALLLAPALAKIASANLRSQAVLNSADAALAAERYRLATSKWPEKLQQVVPRYLNGVASDPFSTGPLRWLRCSDGWTAYSFGPNEKDDGGEVQPKHQLLDVGFRLWDPNKRRQPAPEQKE